MAIITLSRGSLGLGAALAEKLASELGYVCLGREVARDAAEHFGIPHELMTKKVEESPNLWERMTAERTVYVVAMQAILAERAIGGNLIYHGYAGHLLLKNAPALLRVRVIAPMEIRVPLVMEERRIGAEAAQIHIQKMDEARARWTKFVFGVDWQDPRLYDAVFNLGVISIETACAAIAGMARRPEFAVEAAERARLQDFALASQVRLMLVTSPDTRALSLRVEMRDGVASITGVVPQEPTFPDSGNHLKKQLRDQIMSIKGLKDVTFDFDTTATAFLD